MKGVFPINLFCNLKRPRKADTASLTAVLWVENMMDEYITKGRCCSVLYLPG